MHSIVFDSVDKYFGRGGFFLPSRRRIETHALKNISFEVPAGEVWALLGQNGSGKTTTLKLVSGMLLPDRGSVIVDGADTHTHADRVRSRVGFALATERSFFPRLTVRENLEFFAALKDVPRRERPTRIDSILREVDLAPASDKQAMKLSSGMYQRLGIARAIIKNPSVLLLDEPTRSVDPSAASDLWRLMQEIARAGIAILLATHSFAEAIAVADHIAVLHNGNLLDRRRAAGLTLDRLRSYYLDVTGDFEPDCWSEEVPA
jgi:ABC-2 type transport system ATP-binding protein